MGTNNFVEHAENPAGPQNPLFSGSVAARRARLRAPEADLRSERRAEETRGWPPAAEFFLVKPGY